MLDRTPDLALLDLMLPAVNGFELCRRIRECSPVGIIVVSARGGETDKVRALNLGADDYLTKPFGIDELLARIHATLPAHRRARAGEAAPPSARRRRDRPRGPAGHPGRRARAPHAHRVRPPPRAGAARGQAGVPRRAVAPGLGAGYATETEYTRVYVRRLRAKLERDGSQLILTEPRAGYRLAV